MRIISAERIKETISELCIQANLYLRKDILKALESAYQKENSQRAKDILEAIINNAYVAKKEKLALCQDTGLPVVFLEIGQELRIKGNLKEAIDKGIEIGYKRGFLRNSIVNPFKRNLLRFSPGILHTEIVKGNRLKITVLPKGFGCENKSQLKMFNPTASWDEIKKFIVETVKSAGPDACPPYILGVGIGGTADYACLLAKKALLKKIPCYPLSSISYRIQNMEYGTQEMEYDLLTAINRLNIGPMGLGGRTTALAVNINIYPTHIAGLPVAVNISCHALRIATGIL